MIKTWTKSGELVVRPAFRQAFAYAASRVQWHRWPQADMPAVAALIERWGLPDVTRVGWNGPRQIVAVEYLRGPLHLVRTYFLGDECGCLVPVLVEESEETAAGLERLLKDVKETG